jgi:hypothetical protein
MVAPIVLEKRLVVVRPSEVVNSIRMVSPALAEMFGVTVN